mmetsp:Transcript_16091/g.32610  ORF Transcript_16091/g.32610 Transcript_16091/m.32610 type:complete len:218 (-) Transcript_16091:442-1095(-)
MRRLRKISNLSSEFDALESLERTRARDVAPTGSVRNECTLSWLQEKALFQRRERLRNKKQQPLLKPKLKPKLRLKPKLKQLLNKQPSSKCSNRLACPSKMQLRLSSRWNSWQPNSKNKCTCNNSSNSRCKICKLRSVCQNNPQKNLLQRNSEPTTGRSARITCKGTISCLRSLKSLKYPRCSKRSTPLECLSTCNSSNDQGAAIKERRNLTASSVLF